MRKILRIIIVFTIILSIILMYNYKEKINEENATRKEIDNKKIIEVQIIDQYNKMYQLYENPEAEQYVEADIIIDGQYYNNVGIRTKGSIIYKTLDVLKLDNYSFKVKLDYKDKDQRYNGMSEIHLNTSFYDETGIREYLVYEIYNEMGIETQQYYLGHLRIGNLDRGLISIVEVINEEYVEYKYNSEIGNLYKPRFLEESEYLEADLQYFGADLRYLGEDEQSYNGIFENIRTLNTTAEDKKRLINIIRNINNSSSTEVIEENFMDFDKIIKMVAINKVIVNVDVFTGHTLRNFYIYEECGKIDILTFDFDISMDPALNTNYWKDDKNEFDLAKSDIKIHSRIGKIIVGNEEYTKKYYQYVEETQQKLKDMKIDELIDETVQKTKDIVKANEKKIYSYEIYEKNVKMLKEFMIERGNY